jgi:hypothetical protein
MNRPACPASGIAVPSRKNGCPPRFSLAGPLRSRLIRFLETAERPDGRSLEAEEAMFTSLLVDQCTEVLDRVDALQARTPADPQSLFAISGLASDIQRLWAIYLILTDLTTAMVQAEVAVAIGNLVETIGLTYRGCQPVLGVICKKGETRKPRPKPAMERKL